MTCRENCIHYRVCQFHIDEETKMTVNECEHFKNKADFVEVVRCKKCKWFDSYFLECTSEYGKHHIHTENDFCSDGERSDT